MKVFNRIPFLPALILALVLTLFLPTTAQAASPETSVPAGDPYTQSVGSSHGWVEQNGQRYYMTEQGFHTGWLSWEGNWYYLDPNTKAAAVGWVEVGGKWYYMNSQGIMQTGWVQDHYNRYYLLPSGERKTGWLQHNGNWYFLQADGTMAIADCAVDGRLCYFRDDGTWVGYRSPGYYVIGYDTYYVKENGLCARGWTQLDGYWYFFDSDCKMYTGWLETGGKTYYLDEPSGIMLTGWQSFEGDWDPDVYYFHPDGHMHTGWLKQGNNWYYLQQDGVMRTGEATIGGKKYFFYDDGVMAAGGFVQYQPFFYVAEYLYYYADANGVLYTGWHQIDGSWYYFYKNGRMAVDVYIDEYYLNSSGRLTRTANKYPLYNYHTGCTAAQAAQADAIAKAIAQDALKNGGNTDYDRVSYAVDQLHPYYSKTDIDLNAGGRSESIYGVFVDQVSNYKSNALAMARVLDYMGIDWQLKDGVYPCLHFKMDGEYGYAAPMVLDPTIGMAFGPKVGFGNPGDRYVWPYSYDYEAYYTQTAGTWVQAGSDWYYKNTSGKYVTGMHHIGGIRYYFKPNGVMATGWVQYNGNWYYFTSSGAMKTGWLKEGNIWYYLKPNGVMTTGLYKADGQMYYADQNGKMLTGWCSVGGKWLYAASGGALTRGYATIGGVSYYFNEGGEMAVGWAQDLNGGWIYANSSGALAKNCWKTIGGNTYYFYKNGLMAAETFIDNYFVNADGVWEYSVSATPNHQYYKHLTSAQAAQADAIAKAIAQDALANGGNTDLEKIIYASKLVMEYVVQCRYQNDSNYYYRSPYGVFVAGVYTCAGSTRAMGRVLDYMGYTWYHAGEDQWDHQWVCVKMDGEYGWVEPQLGQAGYGNFRQSYIPLT